MSGVVARVLIVDDEPVQMRALCETLRDSGGYEPVGFSDGAAALRALREGRFELLLSDLMMPGMDGIALMRKAQETDPSVLCIIMTGEGSVATAVEAMKSGAFDFILKPFTLSAILPVLSRALAVRQLRLEEAAPPEGLRRSTAVDGFAGMLEKNHAAALDTEGRRLLGVVRASCLRMGRLIDDLLRFSRLGREAPAWAR